MGDGHWCSQERDEAAGDFPRRVSSAMENSIQLLDLEEAPFRHRVQRAVESLSGLQYEVLKI